VVVVGDVNCTLACALITAKLRYEIDCRLAHVEAGLRSHDWRMPEEVIRVLTDRLSDPLLTPSRDADENIRAEGMPEERIRFVGNVMIDTLFAIVRHLLRGELLFEADRGPMHHGPPELGWPPRTVAPVLHGYRPCARNSCSC